jgi:hypothetical protein
VTDGAEVTLWTSRYERVQGWSAAQKLATNPEPDNRRFPRLAVSAGGDAVAVWAQYAGDRHEIYAARYLPGGGWAPPEPIGTGRGDESAPVVAANRGGEFRAFWVQRNLTRHSLWSARSIGVRWESPQLVRDDDAQYESLQIALDDTGNALAAWIESEGQAGRVWTSRWEAQ